MDWFLSSGTWRTSNERSVRASYALLWALVCAQALVLLGVMREIGRILLGSRGGVARDGVRVGARLPDFSFRVGGDERLLRETLDQPLSILLLKVYLLVLYTQRVRTTRQVAIPQGHWSYLS